MEVSSFESICSARSGERASCSFVTDAIPFGDAEDGEGRIAVAGLKGSTSEATAPGAACSECGCAVNIDGARDALESC